MLEPSESLMLQRDLGTACQCMGKRVVRHCLTLKGAAYDESNLIQYDSTHNSCHVEY